MPLALFDLDYTLLSGDSDHTWGHFLAEQAVVDPGEFIQRSDYYLAEYDAGRLDIDEFLAFQTAPLVATPYETLVALRTASRDISEQVDRLASRAEVLIASSDVLVRGGNQLLADSGHDLRATIADLRRTAASLAEVSRGVAHGRGVVGQLLTSDAMARDVNDTVITAAQLTERVADQPEVLFWGTTNEERDQAAREREARQIRRAFMEGFEYREEPVRREEPRVREEEARGDEEGE